LPINSSQGLRNLFGARRIISDRIKRLVNYRIDEHLRELYATVDRLARDHSEVVEDMRRRLADLERRYNEMDKVQYWTKNELERVIPQVAAQESQLESLREKMAAVPAADQPQIDESRTLIDEIRREHSQIRVRLTAVAQYEDRLRKLEDRAE
jgi:chromosome segregation ATPase